MASAEEHIARWVEAGVLDEPVAARLRSFESRSPRSRGGPGILETMVYLGIAVAAVGVVVLVTSSWETLEDWARIAVVGVPGLLALALGAGLRATGEPGLARGGQVAWLVAVALAAGCVAVAGDTSDLEGRDIALLAGAAAVALSLPLWAFSPAHPQVVAMGGAFVTLALALGDRSDEFSFLVAGTVAMVFALAAVALTERGLLTPSTSARVVAGFGLGWGGFFAGFDEGGPEALAFVAAAALIALSTARGVFAYIVFGVAAAFAGLVATITRHVNDPTEAALYLMLIGALLVAAVVALYIVKPWQRRQAA